MATSYIWLVGFRRYFQMKLKLDDVGANVNVDIHIPKDDVSDLIEQVQDATIKIICVATAAHILKKVFEK